MSVRMELKWENVPQMNNYISVVVPNMTRAAEIVGMDRGADEAKKIAKQLCPVGTPESTGIPGYVGGSLKASIRKERHAWPKGNVIYTGIRAGGYVINPNTGKIVDYAGYVEHGTSKMTAQPFIRPALLMAKTLIPLYIYEEMQKRVPRS